MAATLLTQIKNRRLKLGLKQNDMPMRIGVSRQQYQRLEAKGNPRLDTLALIAAGLNSELMLIPKEKLQAVQAILAQGPTSKGSHTTEANPPTKALQDDPWQGLLGDDQ